MEKRSALHGMNVNGYSAAAYRGRGDGVPHPMDDVRPTEMVVDVVDTDEETTVKNDVSCILATYASPYMDGDRCKCGGVVDTSPASPSAKPPRVILKNGVIVQCPACSMLLR